MDLTNTVYFLDFDHTLFHTDEFFHVDVRNAFLRFKINNALWEQSYAAVWPTGYNPEKHVEELKKISNTKLPFEEMNRVLKNSFSDLKRYIFPDVLAFLEYLIKNKTHNIRAYLLSFGNPEWQKYKVTSSGIHDYFDDIFFTAKEGTKIEIILKQSERFQRVIIIDNNPAELDLIKDDLPHATTYCINRVPDDMLIPQNELSRLKFLEARKYVQKPGRHQHIAIKTLNDILSL